MQNHSSFIITLAGIALFMFGMSLASKYLQKLAANRLRSLLARLSEKPILGVGVGIALTVMIQSSGAVTSMLVGLGSAGVITLQQVMSIILGATIGTTITVQLLSFKVAQYGLPLFTFSFTIFFLTHMRTLRRVMGVFMGFGLIFWGLEMIGDGTQVLRQTDLFTNSLSYLKENPLWAIMATAFFTAVVHSSAVTIGFAMTLAQADLLSLSDAIIWVYGANIGTTATALLASSGGNYIGKQVAWAHCFYKIIGVVIFYFFTDLFAGIIGGTFIERDIANAHTFFNLLVALAFFPFISKGSLLIEKLFPPSDKEKQFGVKYLKRVDFESPTIAVSHAEREAMRLADIVLSMIEDSLKLLRGRNQDLEESIKERDNKVDLLNREINLFLAKHVEDTDEEIYMRMLKVMSFATDMESAADVIDTRIKSLAMKMHNYKLDFGKEGWKDLEDLHDTVVSTSRMSVSSFQMQEVKLMKNVVELEREIRSFEATLREAHLTRLTRGLRDSINASSIHLDMIYEYRRLVGIMTNHAYVCLKE